MTKLFFSTIRNDKIKHDKIIFLHARPHIAKQMKEILALRWDVLSHPPYSPDIAPSDYYLFQWSMQHSLSEQHFRSFKNIKKWLDDWIALKESEFFYRGIHLLSKR